MTIYNESDLRMIRRASAVSSAAGLLIVVAAFVLHGGAMGRFWLGDDPQVLLHALRYSAGEVLTTPEAWRELSTSNFTPLVTISFDLDLNLFGPDPEGFYAHQITVIAIAAIAFAILLRILGVGSGLSLAGAITFLAVPPVVHIANQLMTRHYLEGFVIAMVALIVWTASIGIRGGPRWKSAGLAVLAAVLYLLAMLAKEVYATVPLIFLATSIIANEEWRRTAWRLVPATIAALIYIVWRVVMLGGIGGYGTGAGGMHLPKAAGEFLKQSTPVGLWIVVLVLIAAAEAGSSRRALLATLLVMVAVGLPLFGIGDGLEPRHLLVPAAVLLAAAMLSIHRMLRERPRLGVGMLAIVVTATVIGGASQWIIERDSSMRTEAEGRYVWQESEDAFPLLASSPEWYIEGLADFRKIVERRTAPRRLYSRVGALLTDMDHDRIVWFDERGMPRVMSLEDIEGSESRAERYEAGTPLSISIARRDGALVWAFGPDCDCAWIFYSYPGYQPFVVPEEGRRLVPKPTERQWFRLERRERDGSWSMSPPLELPSDGDRLEWRRN
jgi:hypothetical protein